VSPTVPAFLHFDVEPDAFQLRKADPRAWTGFCAAFDFAARLRDALERAGGPRPRFSWYVRVDPQVEEACGRADDVLARFPDRFERLRAEGDSLGVHAHPIRWSRERASWVHDLADEGWLRECTSRSLDAFERATGSPARIYRAGAGVLHEAIVDVLDERGVEVELSLEPVRHWSSDVRDVRTAVDASPIVGECPDCSAAARTPYRPARGDFRRVGGADARRIVLVPVTTAPRKRPPTGLALLARRVVGRPPRPRSTRVLYPTDGRLLPRSFWDLAAFQLTTMERPYLSLGVRTDAPGSALAERVEGLFLALASHALARRLRFVGPVREVEALLPGARREPAASAR